MVIDSSITIVFMNMLITKFTPFLTPKRKVLDFIELSGHAKCKVFEFKGVFSKHNFLINQRPYTLTLF